MNGIKADKAEQLIAKGGTINIQVLNEVASLTPESGYVVDRNTQLIFVPEGGTKCRLAISEGFEVCPRRPEGTGRKIARR